jgi:Asp-tRNA(Asn)/Glu-tRNA(Gln) amidotransferase A subunit family amidase
MYLAMAGYDAADPWSSPQPAATPGDPTSLRETTIGIPHPWVDLPQTEAVAAAFAATATALARAGASIVHLELPDLVPTAQLEHSVYPEVAIVHDQRWHDHPESYGPDVSQRLGQVFEIDPTAYIAAQQWRARIRHTAEAALQQCDFLITPAVAATVKPIGEERIEVAGKMVSYRAQFSRYSALVNHTSMPALALPLEMDGTPPPSLQVIGQRWSEHRLLELGFALEIIGLSGYRQPPIAWS